MSNETEYQNNPLQGVGLQTILTEIVDHYGFKILYAYLNINCFKTNPSIESSLKFLKKTDWAREKVESFYLYKYKNLPRASAKQFELPPRDRIIPEDHKPGKPAELTLKQAENIREMRIKRAEEKEQKMGNRAYAHKKPRPNKAENLKTDNAKTENSKIENSKIESSKAKNTRTETSKSSNQDSDDPWASWKK